jgi:mannose-6-phosphate isomerase class I
MENAKQTGSAWRKTSQILAPALVTGPQDRYTLYPGFSIGEGKISLGFDSLAQAFTGHSQVVIDGFGGVLWENLRSYLEHALAKKGIRVAWHNVEDALLPESKVYQLIEPFLGGNDPLFGTRFTRSLADFFDPQRLTGFSADPQVDMNILYGCGAALAGWDGLLVYVDVPKNEIQFRSRAGSIRNLGASRPLDPKKMYKRFYFVDWVALNAHKAKILPEIDLVVDEQRPDQPAWMSGEDMREALSTISRNYFRVRPWFEPGPWGGDWIKQHIPGLAQDVPNYAWSFELISPENGLAFESSGALLEVSFDTLMFQEYRAVLGRCADRFGFEFPIRYDFLDTFDGGNLSIQVHPRPEYIRENFGETFTQDETYYILDCEADAQVYLGFQSGVDPLEFQAELERSLREKTVIEIERFVKKVPSHKGDLFLIPNGTIHGSGKDNLVLEISATPYIFTFKMYDWMRLDLEGQPRPLNIRRAFENLYFERQGERVEKELVSHPVPLAEGPDWKIIHLPTHPAHFYDVHRLEFSSKVEISTDGSVHVLMLVEGQSVLLETENGLRQRFNYAETFIVPAAANRYWLINEGQAPIKVVKSFMKS